MIWANHGANNRKRTTHDNYNGRQHRRPGCQHLSRRPQSPKQSCHGYLWMGDQESTSTSTTTPKNDLQKLASPHLRRHTSFWLPIEDTKDRPRGILSAVGKLTTPTRAHRDLQLKPHTSHHVCDVHYKGYVTSRHSHFDGRHANASESQAPSNRTYIMAMGNDVIRSIKITQYPGHGKSASSLIAANPKGSS